eukprot:3781348-Alexandrium_andersonii.AAC.1
MFVERCPLANAHHAQILSLAGVNALHRAWSCSSLAELAQEPAFKLTGLGANVFRCARGCPMIVARFGKC